MKVQEILDAVERGNLRADADLRVEMEDGQRFYVSELHVETNLADGEQKLVLS